MATRFGGTSPSRAFQVQTSWVIGGLVVLVVLLLGVVYFTLSQETSDASQGASVVTESEEQIPTTQQVLVSLKRIEAGTALEDYMFESQGYDPSQVPGDAVLANELPSLRGKFASMLINPQTPLRHQDVTDFRPPSAINIPPGYRAITITVDAQTGVEGLVKPDERVDVLCQFNDRSGKPKVATIVRFAKVLSVSGITQSDGQRVQIQGQTTATLLVQEEDARKITLAGGVGRLSLALIGQGTPVLSNNNASAVTGVDEIFGGAQANDQGPREGVAYFTDDQGRQVRYESRNGVWVRVDGE